MSRFARAQARKGSSEEAAEWKEAAPSERTYWRKEWSFLETDFVKFEKAIGGVGAARVKGTSISELQLTSSRNSSSAAKPVPKNTTAQEVAQEPAPKLPKGMNAAALKPMLGMLKGVYDDAKERIAKMNGEEKKR